MVEPIADVTTANGPRRPSAAGRALG